MIRIIAFDPGETTGICAIAVTSKGDIVLNGAEETVLDKFPIRTLIGYIDSFITKVPPMLLPVRVVVESVVLRGVITTAKVAQIRAWDRVIQAAEGLGLTANQISPEARKRHNIVVPTEVKGRHARDAYRLALVYAIKEGIYVPTNPNPEA